MLYRLNEIVPRVGRLQILDGKIQMYGLYSASPVPASGRGSFFHPARTQRSPGLNSPEKVPFFWCFRVDIRLRCML